MAIDLGARVVVVTGSSQNLGRTMAMGLARAGARIVLASPDIERLRGVAEEIGKRHAVAVEADVAREDHCRNVLDQAIRAFGGVDVLINNARNARHGLPDYETAPFWERPVAFWDAAIRVNVFGTYLMSRTIVPHMISRRWGRIVNISTNLRSILARHNSPYGVTKAAIDAETMIWAQDLAGTGVTVNTLHPGGACNTDRPRADGAASGTLLDPEIMTPPAVWLASDLSNGFTGGRYVAKRWNTALDPAQAARDAAEPPIFRVSEGDD
jgi:NAD(P)-dependent dehydrogenase (short-subunit alcohol dehydrogenase family)